MKQNIKQLWARRLKMSRGWKTVRNCVILLLFTFGFWISQGCPALTSNSALRQLERRYFLSPGEIIYDARGQSVGSRAYFLLGENCAYTVNTWRDVLHEVSANIFDETTPDQSPKPLRLPAGRTRTKGELWQGELFVPCWINGAAAAELTLDLTYKTAVYESNVKNDITELGTKLFSEEQSRNIQVPASSDEGSWFRFTISAETREQAALLSEIWTGIGYTFDDDTGTLVNPVSIEYQLNFYDSNHTLIESSEGTLDHWR